MIPDLTGQRTAITAALETLEDLWVYPAAPTGSLPAQFVLIGMPAWSPPAEAVCMPTIEWQIMVCHSRSSNASASALALEGLWPQVLEVLDSQIEQDASWGGLCATSHLEGAEFNIATIQGIDIPCYVITLKMQGA